VRFALNEFFSRVFINERKRYKFTGIIVGRFAIGLTWATVESASRVRAKDCLPGQVEFPLQ